jgi:hypothetical protein
MKSLILVVLGLLFTACSQAQINISEKDLFCEEDLDCVFFVSDCEGCQLEIVNKNNQEKYVDKVSNMCEDVEVEFMCDIIPKTAKCISNKCVIVE